ncbi:MAG: hypothetical protein RMN24_14570, partial [Anaerolineae bacterium]|nr:hypothetical protein [Anaerolineae bacterium]
MLEFLRAIFLTWEFRPFSVGITLLLGARWDTGILMAVFAVVATRIALSSLFAIQGSALFVKKHNWLMFRANVAYAVVFLAIAYPAAALLPNAYKLYGYLVADLI